MADSNVFVWLCKQMADQTSLNTLESRGTVRIAIKQAGLNSRTIQRDEMTAVLRKVMPGELSLRGVEGAEALCEGWVEGLPNQEVRRVTPEFIPLRAPTADQVASSQRAIMEPPAISSSLYTVRACTMSSIP